MDQLEELYAQNHLPKETETECYDPLLHPDLKIIFTEQVSVEKETRDPRWEIFNEAFPAGNRILWIPKSAHPDLHSIWVLVHQSKESKKPPPPSPYLHKICISSHNPTKITDLLQSDAFCPDLRKIQRVLEGGSDILAYSLLDEAAGPLPTLFSSEEKSDIENLLKTFYQAFIDHVCQGM